MSEQNADIPDYQRQSLPVMADRMELKGTKQPDRRLPLRQSQVDLPLQCLFRWKRLWEKAWIGLCRRQRTAACM